MNDPSVSRFWDKYIDKAISYGIKPNATRWHVRHAEAYIKAHADKRLVQHSAHDVDKYLNDKGRNTRLDDWQYKQMVIAVKLLFTKMVQVNWASDYPWDEWVANATSLPSHHATVARDYQPVDGSNDSSVLVDESHSDSGLFKKVYEKYPSHIDNLRKRIRIMQYSIRTEQAYLGWLVRYIGFHSLKDPSNLTEADISRFLEYLVV